MFDTYIYLIFDFNNYINLNNGIEIRIGFKYHSLSNIIYRKRR